MLRMIDVTTDELTKQAEIFGYYLIKQNPSADATALYVKAITHDAPKIDASDTKLLHFVMRHPHYLGLVDAGLPFYKPYSEVRRRLYVLLAILETRTEYHDAFLPKERSFWYSLFILYAGIRATVKTILGSLLVRVV